MERLPRERRAKGEASNGDKGGAPGSPEMTPNHEYHHEILTTDEY
jgi:hypothetical protein